MLIEDALKDYKCYCQIKEFTEKTMKNKQQEYKQLKHYLIEKRGIKEIENVTKYDLQAYVRLKQKDGLQPTSIHSMFRMIKAFFSWCETQGYIQENIAKEVTLPKVPKKVINGFTSDEVQAMINAFSYKTYIECRNKAIIAMLADCGLRNMELRNLKNEDIRDNSILVNGKGNKQRIVFISPDLKRILIRYERLKEEYFIDTYTSDHYFLNYTGGSLGHVALDNIIKKAGERAKIKGKRISPHNFRHYYAVTCLFEGMDVFSLSKLLGHSDISVTQKYLESFDNNQLKQKAVTFSPLMTMRKRK